METSIALFGAAERGDFVTPHLCKKVEDLFSFFGNPPDTSDGIFHAVRILLYGYCLIYIRVQEEGSGYQDYVQGLRKLCVIQDKIPHLRALFLPGVGSAEIVEEGLLVCKKQSSLLIVQETDLYDLLTSQKW